MSQAACTQASAGADWECSGVITQRAISDINNVPTVGPNGILVTGGNVGIHIQSGATVLNNNAGSTAGDAISNNNGHAHVANLRIVNDGTIRANSYGGSNFGVELGLNNNQGSVELINNGEIAGIQAGGTIRTTNPGSTITVTNNATGVITTAASGGITALDVNAVGGSMIRNEGTLYSSGARAIGGSANVEEVHLLGGSVVGAISLGGGDDSVYWSGGTLQGNVLMSGGSDTVVISTPLFDGSQILNGGDDTGTADGQTDTLRLQDVSTTTPGTSLLNWEKIELSNAQLTLSDGAVTAGSDTGTGIFIGSGSTLTSPVALNVTANVDVGSGGTLVQPGGRITGHVVNSGEIRWSQLGQQLQIVGNYTGNGGRLVLETQLGGDTSPTDSLHITGDTAGTTWVRVVNAGGAGAQTVEGIRLIRVDGASSGEFKQEGRIVAGAYDYYLRRGTSAATSGNWYLTSALSEVPGLVAAGSIVRPESGSYARAIFDANHLFVGRLHDRLGETQYTDAMTGERKVTSMWLRHVGGRGHWQAGGDQIRLRTGRTLTQIGGDVAQWESDGAQRLHLGVMAGFASAEHAARSVVSGHTSEGQAKGYSVGLYGTWYENGARQPGWYVDGWAQYNRYNNSVVGEGQAAERYTSRGYVVSIEGGYAHPLTTTPAGDASTRAWFIQPQAQVVWMGVKANDRVEANGTRVSDQGAGNVMLRLGARLFADHFKEGRPAEGSEFKPFVEANVIFNSKPFGVRMNDTALYQSGGRRLGEIRVGLERKHRKDWNFWGNVGYQFGSHGYRDVTATLGVKYLFD